MLLLETYLPPSLSSYTLIHIFTSLHIYIDVYKTEEGFYFSSFRYGHFINKYVLMLLVLLLPHEFSGMCRKLQVCVLPELQLLREPLVSLPSLPE